MTFQSPEWLLLFPALLLIGLIWKRISLWKPLRLLILLALCIMLARPAKQGQEDALDLWVLLDRSDSTEGLIGQGLPEWKTVLEESQPSAKDRLRYINYASEVLEETEQPETQVYTGQRNQTRTKLAIESVLALSDSERPSRILVFSDGYGTTPLGDLSEKLNKANIALDYRIVREELVGDYKVKQLALPSRVQQNEPFLLSTIITGDVDAEVPITITRNGEVISPNDAKIEVKEGVGKLEFTTKLPSPGGYQFAVSIQPSNDSHHGNNLMSKWVEVTGGPKILLVTNYTDDPLGRALGEQGFDVELCLHSESLHIGQLTGVKSVIFHNIPAYEVPNDFLAALPFYVEEQGGGFMMVGGRYSFGSGGYFNSPVDQLLPVSMELKNEHRKLTVALAITMDRSGSMSMNVEDPAGGNVTKMDLANQGAINAVDLLGFNDYLTVHAVDSEAHVILRLQQIADQQAAMKKKIRRIQSLGGGIYVYPALEKAWDELSSCPVGTRHIILFADASDAEEPGQYRKLLEDITKQGGTVSVIGLGTKNDIDAELLKDVARLGNGRIFFTERAVDIPNLFAQETVTMARSAFITESVPTQLTGHWQDISSSNFPLLETVDSYNLSYARDGATVSLVSDDQYNAPLISHTRKGLGRTAAISFPMGGELSETIRSWDRYGDFVQTIGRWVMGEELPSGIGMRHKIAGNTLNVDLFYDTEEWSDEFGKHAPEILLSENNSKALPLAWKRVRPGHFSLERELNEGGVARGVIQVGKYVLPFGPLAVGANTEWQFDRERLDELRAASVSTGGRELHDLSQAWLRPPALSEVDLRPLLLISVLVLALWEIFLTRTGWSIRGIWSSQIEDPKTYGRDLFQSKSERKSLRNKASSNVKPTSSDQTSVSKKSTSDDINRPNKNEEGDSRRSRFNRAKSRK